MDRTQALDSLDFENRIESNSRMDMGENSRNVLVDKGPGRQTGMNFPPDRRIHNQRLDQDDFGRNDFYQDQNRLRMPRYIEFTKIEGIEKLNGKNFKTWKTDLEIALSERNLWTLVNGERDEREPVNIQDQQLAYKIIYQSCETHVKDMISDTRDPLVAWKKIEETFNPKNMITQINSVLVWRCIALLDMMLVGMILTYTRLENDYFNGHRRVSPSLNGHLQGVLAYTEKIYAQKFA